MNTYTYVPREIIDEILLSLDTQELERLYELYPTLIHDEVWCRVLLREFPGIPLLHPCRGYYELVLDMWNSIDEVPLNVTGITDTSYISSKILRDLLAKSESNLRTAGISRAELAWRQGIIFISETLFIAGKESNLEDLVIKDVPIPIEKYTSLPISEKNREQVLMAYSVPMREFERKLMSNLSFIAHISYLLSLGLPLKDVENILNSMLRRKVAELV